ncbi:hypothetical protein Bbelb_026810 [Branchiostoma belcheri]|nr:hypothetical protein Bbelb_384540 [Branchiostoma belcheri]KAI8519424.1 hypothetical protein Bbelb_026810 [Branchiostoma belcheri]
MERGQGSGRCRGELTGTAETPADRCRFTRLCLVSASLSTPKRFLRVNPGSDLQPDGEWSVGLSRCHGGPGVIHHLIKIWFQNRRTKWKRKFTNDLELMAHQHYASMGLYNTPHPWYFTQRYHHPGYYNFPSCPAPSQYPRYPAALVAHLPPAAAQNLHAANMKLQGKPL